LAAGLSPDPLRSLSAPADSIAVAGRRCHCGIKVEAKGGGKKAMERREREAAHPQIFL